MNIHIRATARLLNTLLIPAVAGIAVAVIFTFVPMQQLLLGLAAGLVVFMLYLFYSWTLDQIRKEDQLKETMNDQTSR